MGLINNLIKEGWLKTPQIIKAFQKIKREDFLPSSIKSLAELNEALPIGFGQTISQPLTVAFMLELLEPKSGDKILDVGAGSGWTTALLAYIVSNGGEEMKGRVIAIEIIPQLYEFGKENVKKYNFIEKGIVEYIEGDGSKGFKKYAPYDKILVSAAVWGDIPFALKEQLKIGGRLVIPVENSIYLIIKKNDSSFEEEKYPGFVFVPLVQRKT